MIAGTGKVEGKDSLAEVVELFMDKKLALNGSDQTVEAKYVSSISIFLLLGFLFCFCP